MRRLAWALGFSLRGRLLLMTLTWVLVTVIAAGWALNDLFHKHIERQVSGELAVHMNLIVGALTVNEQGEVSLSYEPSDPRLQRPLSGLYWQVDQITPGQPVQDAILHSRSLWDEMLQLPNVLPPVNDAGLERLTGPGGTPLLAFVRVVAPAEGVATYRVIVAADRKILDQPMAQFRLMLFIALGLLALGMTLAAIMQVVVGLRPLVNLRKRLANVREGQQTQIQGHFPSEIQPLVDEFNQVLQNNNEIVQRARTQAGNLAHALKTPLSILANGANHENTPFGEMVAEQVSLARRQVDHHLARARAAAAYQTPGMRAQVWPVVQGLSRVLSKLFAAKGVQLNMDTASKEFAFKGEQHDLQEMLGNLLENAFKWCDKQVWITIQQTHSDSLVFDIEDDGLGLSASQCEQIFERGVRLDEIMPGSGLGLSIVRDLALAYGGRVSAGKSIQGGLSVKLVLPAVEQSNA